MSKLVFLLLLLEILNSMTYGAVEVRTRKDCGEEGAAAAEEGEGCHGGGEEGSGTGGSGSGIGGSGNGILGEGNDIIILHPTNKELQSEVYLFAGILGGFVLLISAVVVYVTAEVVGLKTKLKKLEKKQASSSERPRGPPPAYTVNGKLQIPI